MQSWEKNTIYHVIQSSRSLRQVLHKLGIKASGGNYITLRKYINKFNFDIKHFYGKGWRKNIKKPTVPAQKLSTILSKNSTYQSHKLKIRLIREGLKKAMCEECGWAKMSLGGRIPLELDHINGIHSDNRLVNLRILCPNCHSLKPTHRGKNKAKYSGQWRNW